MSDAGNLVRETGAAVDQGSRAAADPDAGGNQVEVLDDADVIEDLRRQIAEREAAGREQIAELERERSRANTEARARLDAEARARAAEEARRTAEQTGQRSVDESQLEAVKGQLSVHETQLEQLAARKSELIAEGKFEELPNLDVQMAKIGGRIAQLEDGRAVLEERIKNPAPAAGGEGRSAVDGGQAFSEAERRQRFIDQQPPLVRQWLRSAEGERFFTDREFQETVSAAARLAERQHPISSPEYIDYVREAVGLRPRASAEAAGHSPPPASPPAQPRGRDAGDSARLVAAPPGGAIGGSVRRNADGSTDVHLTRNEREMANRMGISPAEYARHKRDLTAEGRIGPAARR